ncbi:MAG: hypothetical protein EAX87_00460 [Candidatus Thorarchaeota archaeon]|nr:hypothetical protein [Candidatus Thorarchaeota archaeon]
MGKPTLDDGFAFLGRGDIYDAFEVFEELSDREPNNPLPMMFMGDIYLLNDDAKKASKAHKEAMSLDERCSYPEVHVAVEQGEAKWTMSFRTGHVTRLRYNPAMGITFESPTGQVGWINLGRNRIRLQIPNELDIKVNRTESLQALIAPIHPYLGPLKALLQKALGDQFELQVYYYETDVQQRKKPRFRKEKEVDAWSSYGIAFEMNDNYESAIDSFSWALTVNPWDSYSQKALMKCLKRNLRGEKIRDFANHPVVKNAFSSDSKITVADAAQAGSDECQIALRIFDFIDYLS